MYYAKSKVRDDDIIICTFDTETDGLGGKLECCTWSTPDSPTGISIGENSVIYWLDNIFFNLPSPCIHFAHFAQYDFRYIIPELIQRGYEIDFNLRTDSDIYQITVKIGKKKFIMRDSFAIFPDKLENFAEMFAPDNKKLKLDFSQVKFDKHNIEHQEYAIRDAVALRESLKNYFDSIYKIFDVTAGHTVAGTAMRAWQKTLDCELMIPYSKADKFEDFIRDAYYGGLVFLTSNKQHENCRTYDINSSYPYTMQTYAMPFGAPVEIDDYIAGQLAIYDVSIIVPDDCRIPILPSRNHHGGMEFRRGTLRTKITNIELEFALTHGCVLLEIFGGITWPATINPFYNFIEKCKNIRREHKGKPYEKIAKLMQNSVYGKFAAKRSRHAIVLGSENLDEDVQAVPFSEELDDLFIIEEYSETMPCKPEWSVFITAYSRLKLISTAYAIGAEHVLYGDTDSLTLTSNADVSLIDAGNEYGQFKLEKEWDYFRAIAPKTYAGKLKSGKWTGAGKGLSMKAMNEKKYKELFEQGETEVDYESLSSLIVSLKRGMEPAKMLNKKSTDIAKSKNYDLIDGEIYLKKKQG